MQFTKTFSLIIALIFLFSAFLGMLFSWSGIVFAFLGAIFTLLLLLLLFIQLFSSNSLINPISLIFILWGAQIIGLGANILRPMPDPILENPDDHAHQLEFMYNTSLSDQQQIKYFLFDTFHDEMRHRDSVRISQLMEYHEEGLIEEPKEKYHAATILRRGYESEHFETGYELAQEAEADDPDLPNITRLKETLYDQWQMEEGAEGEYGTHSLPIPGNL